MPLPYVLLTVAGGVMGGLLLFAWLRSARRTVRLADVADGTSGPIAGDDIPHLLADIEETLRQQREHFAALSASSPPEVQAQHNEFLANHQALLQRLTEASESVRRRAENLEQCLREARTDPLTGVWNRRAFDEHLAVQLEQARRYQVPFSLLLVDIDHFKQVNDRFGHPAGDAVLRQIAMTLVLNVRAADLVCRYGGEEFALLLPQTDRAGAATIAERLRLQIQNQVFRTDGHDIHLRISGGIACVHLTDEPSAILARADRALYRSKREGRNCVHLHTGDGLVAVKELKPVNPDAKVRGP